MVAASTDSMVELTLTEEGIQEVGEEEFRKNDKYSTHTHTYIGHYQQWHNLSLSRTKQNTHLQSSIIQTSKRSFHISKNTHSEKERMKEKNVKGYHDDTDHDRGNNDLSSRKIKKKKKSGSPGQFVSAKVVSSVILSDLETPDDHDT